MGQQVPRNGIAHAPAETSASSGLAIYYPVGLPAAACAISTSTISPAKRLVGYSLSSNLLVGTRRSRVGFVDANAGKSLRYPDDTL